MVTPPVQAVIFDAYGTLLHVRRRLIAREIPKCLGLRRDVWMAFIRDTLLVQSFPDVPTFARFVCERHAPGADGATMRAIEALVEEELASVEVAAGARSLLDFLRRRGLRVGLLSNLISPHKEPIERLGIAERVAAATYSCDAGRAKPDPRLFEDLCRQLDAAPQSALMVGDSLHNDVVAARSAGLRALRIGGSADALDSVAELGWRCLDDDHRGALLIADGQRISLGTISGSLRGLTPLPDEEQGRYNLIARGRFEPLDGAPAQEVFCKRFLFREAVHVEAFMHGLLAALRLPCCETVVTDGPEACLVASRAPGEKLSGEVTPELAREVGRHGALAYLFANADLRPRNAFVADKDGRPLMTMIDLEHCLFNLALDVSGLDDPMRPQTIDGLAEEERQARLITRVLSPRATRRARRSFFDDGLDSERGRSFADGWCDTYHHVQRHTDIVCDLMAERLARPPYLIIGTLAHRRAFANVDLADIRRRLGEDPMAALRSAF